MINADDAHAAFFRSRAGKRRTVEFGLDHGAAVTGRYQLERLSSDIRLRTPAGEADATLAIPGLHNVRNALAAAACAHAVGITASTIAAGLAAFRPYTGRLQVKQARGRRHGDRRQLQRQSGFGARGDRRARRRARRPPRWCSATWARSASTAASSTARSASTRARKGVTQLLALGEATRDAVAAFGAGARHFDAVEELLAQHPRRKPSWSRARAS